MAATVPHLRVSHVCEDDGETERWDGHRGRLALAMLRQTVPDLLRREVFTCGPPGYMGAVRRMLAAAGLPEDRCHEESFEAPATVDAPGATAFAVELARSGRTIACDAGTSVLEAAARAGITLPSSCGQGLCGTCATTLEKGSVDMRQNGGLRPGDVARNQILLCCSTPLEDLVIDV